VAELLGEQGFFTTLIAPSPMLADFGGEIDLSTKSDSVAQMLTSMKVSMPGILGPEHFVPRGCVLRNTPWIVSLAAYCGNDTKTRLNMQPARSKLSNMQHYLNLAVTALVIGLVSFCIYIACAGEATESPLVKAVDVEPGFLRVLARICVYWAIAYQVVPISLYIASELMKVTMALWINLDKSMVDPRTEKGATARTSDGVEEIGQVDFVF
jgi:magnesium-transporting ATPase (P-type)